MANIPEADCRPELFLPPGTNIEVPWDARTPRVDFTFQGPIHKTDEYFAAVIVKPQPPVHLIDQLIQEVANIITHQHQMQVVRIQRCSALCIVQLSSTLARDVLVGGELVLLGKWFHARFVNHDQLANWRNSPYTREGWLMILGIPLHLKTRPIIERLLICVGNSLTGTTVTESSVGFWLRPDTNQSTIFLLNWLWGMLQLMGG